MLTSSKSDTFWPQLHDGVFDGQQHARQAGALLDELVWWAEVLRAGRARA